MSEAITTLSIILLVCTITIAVSNALTAYAIHWERKQKNAPPVVGFMEAEPGGDPKFFVGNNSELLYQFVRIQFSGNVRIYDPRTQDTKVVCSPNAKELTIWKFNPGDSITGRLHINIPKKTKLFVVEFRIYYPADKIIARGKRLIHYFKKLDTDEIFYVSNVCLSKLTFISKFKHKVNLCHCRKVLEDFYKLMTPPSY